MTSEYITTEYGERAVVIAYVAGIIMYRIIEGENKGTIGWMREAEK